MLNNLEHKPTLALVALSGCRGCQSEILSLDEVLPDLFGQVDIKYWDMISDNDMPDEVDIAVIEGAVVNDKSIAFLKNLRKTSKIVISIGACACGLGGKSADDNEKLKVLANGEIASIADVIDVDFSVRGCPIDEREFIATLQKAIFGHNTFETTATLCGQCKGNEVGCFFGRGKACAGLVTQTGCGAICTRLGRICMGCRGISSNVNLTEAESIAKNSEVENGEEALCKIQDACNVRRFVGKDLSGLSGDFAAFTASRFSGEWSHSRTIEALEDFEQKQCLEIDGGTKLLRELLLLGELIKNHVSFIYFSQLRKAYGYVDLCEFENARASELEEALACRHAGTSICEVVGGRSVHPITAVVGGFTHLPDISQIEGLRAQIAGEMDFAIHTVDVCNEVWEKFESPEDTPAMRRILAAWDNLCDDARFAAAKVSLIPPVQDPRRECVAAAVELVNSLARAQEVCKNYISLYNN